MDNPLLLYYWVWTTYTTIAADKPCPQANSFPFRVELRPIKKLSFIVDSPAKNEDVFFILTMNWHISDHFFSILFNSIASLSLRYKTLFRLKGQTHLHFRFDNSSNLFICCFGGKRLASRSFLSVLAPFFSWQNSLTFGFSSLHFSAVLSCAALGWDERDDSACILICHSFSLRFESLDTW